MILYANAAGRVSQDDAKFGGSIEVRLTQEAFRRVRLLAAELRLGDPLRDLLEGAPVRLTRDDAFRAVTKAIYGDPDAPLDDEQRQSVGRVVNAVLNA